MISEAHTFVSGLGRLARWHLPGGPVGPPAAWAATSNVVGGRGTEEEIRGPLTREGGLSSDKLFTGVRVPSYSTALGAGHSN